MSQEVIKGECGLETPDSLCPNPGACPYLGDDGSTCTCASIEGEEAPYEPEGS